LRPLWRHECLDARRGEDERTCPVHFGATSVETRKNARRRRHDYLKSLAQLLAEHGRKSGADMKKLLDPNSASHCKSKQVIISDSDDE